MSELNKKIYNEITRLCKLGDYEAEGEYYDDALKYYYDALELVPLPKTDWEASTWIYVAIGDALYLKGEYEKSQDNMFEALKCPDGIGNPFINLRIGECFYELGNKPKAKEYLIQAYMMAGKDIFETQKPEYFDVISHLV